MRVVRSRTRWARGLRAACYGVTALLLGCHGNIYFTPGTPVISMGAMSPDPEFASYIVTLYSITLTDNMGNVVAVPLQAETIDLARFNDITELVGAPAVQSATYTSASVTLDYTAASIWVNVNGQAVLASAVNTAGAAVTTVTATVTFDPGHPFVVTQGVSTRVHLDIDLAASNHINYSTSTPTVTVQPFLMMTPVPVDATVLRSHGLFVVAQPTSSDFIMNTRPFFDLTSTPLGALTVNIGAQTYFNIDGVTYTGAAGLAAMGTQLESTPIVTYGTLDNLSGITPTFNATSVYVGTSTESEVYEYLTGIVAARSGDTLTVRGVDFLSPINIVTQYNLSYLASLPVTIGSSTIVSEDGVAARNLSSASVSVGQQITVYGQEVTNSSGTVTRLDATSGQLRLQPTALWGTLNSASAGTASLNLLSLGNFAPAGFDFAGTGLTAAQDATVGAYQLGTGSLNESSVPAGTLLEAKGLITPFGSAPPDFQATTITPGASTLQQLVVEWINGGATAPFSSNNAAGLVVNLKNADLGTIHYVRTGPTTVNLTTLPATSPFTLTTVGADQSNLQLAVGSATLTSGISVFNSAARFSTALASTLNGTNKVFRLVAYGQYASATNTFVASRIFVALEET